MGTRGIISTTESFNGHDAAHAQGREPSALGMALWRFTQARLSNLGEMQGNERYETFYVDWSKASEADDDIHWHYRLGGMGMPTKLPYMEVLYKPLDHWVSLGRWYFERPEPNWYSIEAQAFLLNPQAAKILTKEERARAIEARAQGRGPHAEVWFSFPGGVREYLSYKEERWHISRIVPGWGLCDLDVPMATRLEGVKDALARGGQEQ